MPDYANPQSLNRYSYVLNNPLRYTDPTGHREVIGDDKNGNPILAPWQPLNNNGGGNDDNDEDVDIADIWGLPEPNLGFMNMMATAYNYIYNNIGYSLSGAATIDIPNQNIQWCDLLDCVLSGAGFFFISLYFCPSAH